MSRKRDKAFWQANGRKGGLARAARARARTADMMRVSDGALTADDGEDEAAASARIFPERVGAGCEPGEDGDDGSGIDARPAVDPGPT